MQEYIKIINGHENNLKGINLEIPKNQITVFTGVSGSGKSSIVFDTIAQEAGRQLNETYSSFARQFLPKYNRPSVDEIINLSPAIIVDQKGLSGNARSTVGTVTEINNLFRLLFSRYGKPLLGPANFYSFNDPNGMCLECEGIGRVIDLDLENTVDFELSLNEGAIKLPGYKPGTYQWQIYGESKYFDADKPIKKYTKKELNDLLYRDEEETVIDYRGKEFKTTYEGLVKRFRRQYLQKSGDTTAKGEEKLKKLTKQITCPKCEGKRYNEQVLEAKIAGYSIHDFGEMQLDQLVVEITKAITPETEAIIKNIISRAQSLCDIGLSYINLNRDTTSLSGGEAQRIKMVKHLSSSLCGMVYIFDEPSTGLHPRDVYRLNDMLKALRDKGNTVVVVEHDPDVISAADYVVDVGPHAGKAGGEITFTGTYEQLLGSDTLTGKFLSRNEEINETPRTNKEMLKSSKSELHNLKNVALEIPKGVFTVVSGVAGSGKSTLVNQVFAKEQEEVIFIDQNAIHTNSRSNPATYTGIQNNIRKLFAKETGAELGMFSANSTGACPKCKGTGKIELSMSFMDNVQLECDECLGKRFKPEVYEYTYNGKNIIEVMDMSVSEAIEYFDNKPILKKLQNLELVGLEYMSLGQSLSTLSGGECQRLKLANELNSKGNIYILDEPTTGLHMSDITKILNIINTLVDKGNTVIAIEHNLDIIRSADYIVDIGPDGGNAGGEIIFSGLVKDLMNCQESITAKYLFSK